MKPQAWIIGSQNTNTEDRTDLQANQAWNPLEILKAGILNGMFKKDSEQLKIVSDEICNFLTSAGKTPDPNDSTQMSEVYNDIKAELADVVTKTFSFKGYVGQTAPSSSTYTLNIGDMWINSANMPTTIPVSASDISLWDGTAWISATNSYTPITFDTFSDLENNEGYYWFGGEWKIISTDLSLDYFSLNTTTGKWEIKSNVNLPGNPTTTTPESTDNSTKVATTAFVTTAISTASVSVIKPGTILPWAGDVVPYGYLVCNGAEVSRTTYAGLFSICGTIWGAGDGSTTFNVPNFTDSIPWGSSSNIGNYTKGQIPDIVGDFSSDMLRGDSVNSLTGVFSSSTQGTDGYTGLNARNGKKINNFKFKASSSQNIFGNYSLVRPASRNTLYIIKY